MYNKQVSLPNIPCFFLDERKGLMMKKVAVIMGSDSDWGVVQKAVSTLKAYGVPCETHVMSAHRTPADAAAFASAAGRSVADAGKIRRRQNL